MIFVITGSQKFQFNRLLKKIDDLVASGELTEEVFAQTGHSDYCPQNYEYKNLLGRDEFQEWTKKSDLVITHGGTGAIIGALKSGKKVVAVPRLAQYGEHVDDHQTQLLKQFEESNLITYCMDVDKLMEAIVLTKSKEFRNYQSNTQVIIDDIEGFLLGSREK